MTAGARAVAGIGDAGAAIAAEHPLGEDAPEVAAVVVEALIERVGERPSRAQVVGPALDLEHRVGDRGLAPHVVMGPLAPQVEDEVLVAFEHGYLNRPMIIGSLWNVEDKPPEAMDDQGKNDLRVIHSRSGHRIVLNDSKDKPSILIVDKTGDNSFLIDSAQNAMTIKVKGNLTIDVGGDLSIKVQGKIAVDAGRDITAETKANLKAKATGQGSLESTGPLKVKSGAKLTADGSGQAELKAATVSVSGSTLTEVKGTLVKIN